MDDAQRALCAELLQRIADDPTVIDGDERLKGLIARIHKQGRRGARQAQRTAWRADDDATRRSAAMARRTDGVTPEVISAPGAPSRYRRPATCYICKASYRDVHPLYHALCPDCAALNESKRNQRADLTGYTALVTGARIKIGFELTLKLLRDGASVIATTRFPRDAARRFAAQPDAAKWRDRLSLHALDLRFLPAVEAFAQRIERCDILIHNAAQTIRRPDAYYAPLIAAEVEALPEAAPTPDYDALAACFPPGQLDRDGQPLDARPENSWRLRLGEVETIELAETLLVGAMAPFVLTSALRPVLARSPHPKCFVVAASAMEGKFHRPYKTEFHPHTNMAKAALNMLTRTSAEDLARDRIYLNSVDTGWITDENPLPVRERTAFLPPLDCVDGAARLYDPIVRGLTDPEPPYGQFYKDYAPTDW